MWLLFDAVGTLIHPDPPVAEVYHAAGREYGSALAIAEIGWRFPAALSTESWSEESRERPPGGEAAEVERWRRIVRQVLDDVASEHQPALFDSLWNHFKEPQHWRLYPDVAPALVKLAAAGWRLGIASNFDARLRNIVAGLPALAVCERMFLSSEIGYSKPDPRFFTAAQRQLGVPGEQIKLVGDDWQNDIAAARAAGWQAEWLCREASDPAEPHVKSLAELISA
jgi:putative hydrolase of the HAD superfamily